MSEVEDALRPHVHQQVEDAEVGQETVLLGKHLIVGPGLEVGVWQRMLGPDDIAEIRYLGVRGRW